MRGEMVAGDEIVLAEVNSYCVGNDPCHFDPPASVISIYHVSSHPTHTIQTTGWGIENSKLIYFNFNFNLFIYIFNTCIYIHRNSNAITNTENQKSRLSFGTWLRLYGINIFIWQLITLFTTNGILKLFNLHIYKIILYKYTDWFTFYCFHSGADLP